MTQFGEPIFPATIDAEDQECPFDHDPGDPPKVDNILIGDGQELGGKMRDRCGTHLYDKVREDVTVSIRDPRDPPTGLRMITISIRHGQGVRKATYPITCAAHHCVPAQESVKGHNILQYMCKKNAKH